MNVTAGARIRQRSCWEYYKITMNTKTQKQTMMELLMTMMVNSKAESKLNGSTKQL